MRKTAALAIVSMCMGSLPALAVTKGKALCIGSTILDDEASKQMGGGAPAKEEP